jgi:hypothetical protein
VAHAAEGQRRVWVESDSELSSANGEEELWQAAAWAGKRRRRKKKQGFFGDLPGSAAAANGATCEPGKGEDDLDAGRWQGGGEAGTDPGEEGGWGKELNGTGLQELDRGRWMQEEASAAAPPDQAPHYLTAAAWKAAALPLAVTVDRGRGRRLEPVEAIPELELLPPHLRRSSSAETPQAVSPAKQRRQRSGSGLSSSGAQRAKSEAPDVSPAAQGRAAAVGRRREAGHFGATQPSRGRAQGPGATAPGMKRTEAAAQKGTAAPAAAALPPHLMHGAKW